MKTTFNIGVGAVGAMTTPSAVVRFIHELPLDKAWLITVEPDSKDRTLAQNKLSFRWYGEIAKQKPDDTPDGWRAYCKLRIGVPILRIENEAFREQYDTIIRPLDYEQKLALMSPPIDLPITSLMTVKQFTSYLDEMQRHFAEQGVILSSGDDLYQEALGRKRG